MNGAPPNQGLAIRLPHDRGRSRSRERGPGAEFERWRASHQTRHDERGGWRRRSLNNERRGPPRERSSRQSQYGPPFHQNEDAPGNRRQRHDGQNDGAPGNRRQRHDGPRVDDSSRDPTERQRAWFKEMRNAYPETALRLAREHGEEFDSQNLACAVDRIGKGSRKFDVKFLAELCLRRIEKLEARQLADVCSGLAQQKFADKAFFTKCAEECLNKHLTGEKYVRPMDLTHIVWSFATLAIPAPRLFDQVAKVALSRVGLFSPGDLAFLAWSFGAANETSSESASLLFEAIADLASRRLSEFKKRDLANLAFGLAKGLPPEKTRDLFRRIADAAMEQQHDIFTDAAIKLAYAFATVGVKAPEFFQLTAQRFRHGKPQNFNPPAPAQAVWAFARAGVSAPECFRIVAEVAARRVDEFAFEDLAAMLWAFAKSFQDDAAIKGLFDHVARRCQENVVLTSASPHVLATLAWAYAKADDASSLQRKQLLEAIAAVVEPQKFVDTHDLADAAWALATTAAAETIAAEAQKRIADFSTRDVAAVACAFSDDDTKAEWKRPLFEAIAAEASSRNYDDAPKALANTVSAVAEILTPPDALLEALVDRLDTPVGKKALATLLRAVSRALDDETPLSRKVLLALAANTTTTPSEKVMLLRALATFGVSAPDAFRAFAADAQKNLADFSARDVADALWAFAKADVAAPRLFGAGAGEVARRIDQFDSPALAQLLWAFACTQWPVKQLFTELGDAVDVAALADRDCALLSLVTLYVDVEWPDLPFAPSTYRDALRSSSKEEQPSFAGEVAAMLPKTWQRVSAEGIAAGFAETPASKKIVQACGPRCYASGSDGEWTLDGAAQFKARLLASRGWHVARVAFYEWPLGPVGLATKLDAIGVVLGGDGEEDNYVAMIDDD